jgi:hypothetical protein
VRELEGKRSLGRPKRRLELLLKMDFEETGWEGMDRLHMAENRDTWWAVVNTVMSLRVSSDSWNFCAG